MPNIRHLSINGYSGPVIQGTVKYKPSPDAGHLERVFYVTSVIESGASYGAIVQYDGTTITAGLHQAILTYPKELMSEDFNAGDDVGELSKLLVQIAKLPTFPEFKALGDAFMKAGWALGSDGLIRYTKPKVFPLAGKSVSVKTGDLVYGADLRNTITPMNGKVPASGALWDQACSWALLFHKVFIHPSTFSTQISFGLEHTKALCKRRLDNGQPISTFIYGNSQDLNPLIPELDLAMTVLWSHSVNAPAIAMQKLNQALASASFPGYTSSSAQDQAKLAKILLKLLGTSTYGRWNFAETSGRWARTRLFCQATPYWPKSFFASNGIMPQGF